MKKGDKFTAIIRANTSSCIRPDLSASHSLVIGGRNLAGKELGPFKVAKVTGAAALTQYEQLNSEGELETVHRHFNYEHFIIMPVDCA